MPLIRDVVSPRPKAAPSRRASMRDANAALAKLAKGIRDLGQSQERLGSAMTRLRDAAAPIAAARQAMRDEEARYAARVERSTPASVQAANAARWPRS